MKNLLACFGLVVVSLHLFAADVKVDATGAVAGSHTTIQAAINAAANGDRVVIFPNDRKNYSENLSLNKSLTVLCATQEEYFFLVGNITITPANGREITIIGMHQNGNISSASANPVGARCAVNVVDCKILGSVTFNHDGFDVNLLYNTLTKVEIRHGKVIANELGKKIAELKFTGDLKISGENVSYGSGDTVFIIANRIRKDELSAAIPIEFNNANARYFIANNAVRHENGYSPATKTAVRITACLLTDSANVFINNYVSAYEGTASCTVSSTTAAAELKGVRPENVVNNIFYNANGSGAYGCPVIGTRGDYNYYHRFVGYPAATGQIDNNIGGYGIIPGVTYDAETGKVTAGADGIDNGKPGVAYMDIDLTRNDLGTYGGPYSQENYWDTANPQGGRARVFLLDMPSKIYSLTSPTVIKANSTHTK